MSSEDSRVKVSVAGSGDEMCDPSSGSPDASAGGDGDTKPEGVLINEVQLLLAEKRTSLSVLRTGITIFALPLSVLSVLVATSKHYDVTRVLALMVPLLVLCLGLVALAIFLTHRAVTRIRRYDRAIQELKRKHSVLAEFVD
jgi:uncharacterized membrane protein YidH (DUF202 family)